MRVFSGVEVFSLSDPKGRGVRQEGWDAGRKSTLGGYVSEHAGLFFFGKFP